MDVPANVCPDNKSAFPSEEVQNVISLTLYVCALVQKVRFDMLDFIIRNFAQ